MTVMDRRRFARLQELFDGALERPEAERDWFIDEECAGDDDLGGQVRRLLNVSEAAERLGTFLYPWSFISRLHRIAPPSPASPRHHRA